MADERLRLGLGDLLGKAEVLIYGVMGVLLFITALAAAVSAGSILWSDIRNWTLAAGTLGVLDQLLLVLMLVELLHTVSISIRSHILVTEPFLVVGLIASIRRILVITLQAASLTKGGDWSGDNAALFRASMYELALLGVLILILVVSITMLRRSESKPVETVIT
jgi:uncharacterized membrane protein (DUF373 family)